MELWSKEATDPQNSWDETCHTKTCSLPPTPAGRRARLLQEKLWGSCPGVQNLLLIGRDGVNTWFVMICFFKIQNMTGSKGTVSLSLMFCLVPQSEIWKKKTSLSRTTRNLFTIAVYCIPSEEDIFKYHRKHIQEIRHTKTQKPL